MEDKEKEAYKVLENAKSYVAISDKRLCVYGSTIDVLCMLLEFTRTCRNLKYVDNNMIKKVVDLALQEENKEELTDEAKEYLDKFIEGLKSLNIYKNKEE